MSAAPVRPPEGEILALTAIRGLAAWWVVLFHLRAFLSPWLPSWAMAALAAGNLAVDFFFLLSGFVIYLNYAGRTEGLRGIADFLFARFARVYPLHFLMLLGFLGYFGAAALAGGTPLADQDSGYFLASLLLVQNWGAMEGPAWNVPAWSISAEAFAYLAFPALLALLAPRRRPAWALAAAIAMLGLSVQPFFAAFGYRYPDAVAETGLFRCVVQFVMGMMLCELYLRLRGRALAAPLLGAVAALAVAAMLGAPVVPLVWAALILALALARGGPLDRPAFVWLGQISYATYLSHYLLLTLFKYLFVEEGRAVGAGPVALYLAAVLAASALLYHGFERPAQRWLRGRWKRRRTAAVGPPAPVGQS